MSISDQANTVTGARIAKGRQSSGTDDKGTMICVGQGLNETNKSKETKKQKVQLS